MSVNIRGVCRSEPCYLGRLHLSSFSVVRTSVTSRVPVRRRLLCQPFPAGESGDSTLQADVVFFSSWRESAASCRGIDAPVLASNQSRQEQTGRLWFHP